MRRVLALTLVELLVVLAVVGVLSALLFSASQKMMAKGAEAKCLSNLRQISASMIMWASQNNGTLPPQTFATSGLQWNNPGSPFFEFMLNKQGIANDWNELVNTVLKCPGSKVKGSPDGERDNSYGRNTHLALADYSLSPGNIMREYQTPLSRIENPSKAALVADWPLPNFARDTLNSEARKNNLWSRHSDGMKVAFVDGHVGFVSRAQWETWMGAGGGSQEQKDFRMFLTGLERNNTSL